MNRGPRWNRLHRALAGVLLGLLLLGQAGCGGNAAAPPTERLTQYGTRRGLSGMKSLNGLGVLAKLFEGAGHRVSSWDRISPHVKSFDVVVWAPDDFLPPNEQQREFFEQWLRREGESPRVLIYIGRDHEAVVPYLEEVAARAPAQRAPELQAQLAEARRIWSTRRAQPEAEFAGWFQFEPDAAERPAGALAGPWAEEVTLTEARVQLGHRYRPAEQREISYEEWENSPDFEPLLTSGDEILVSRLTWHDSDSHVLLVSNGSFLLNGALVNHAHRRLAGKLVEEIGPAPRKVLFLETGIHSREVHEEDELGGIPGGYEALVTWPIGAILLHVIVLGIVTCFYLLPIFGRPRELPREPLGDFGKHLEAVGRLLAATGDEAYARRKLEQYRETVKGSGDA